MIPDEEQGVLPEIPHKGILQPRLYQTPGILDLVPGCDFRDIVVFLAVDSVLVTCVGRGASRPVTTDFRKREIEFTHIFRVLTIFIGVVWSKNICTVSRPHNQGAQSPARVNVGPRLRRVVVR